MEQIVVEPRNKTQVTRQLRSINMTSLRNTPKKQCTISEQILL